MLVFLYFEKALLVEDVFVAACDLNIEIDPVSSMVEIIPGQHLIEQAT